MKFYSASIVICISTKTLFVIETDIKIEKNNNLKYYYYFNQNENNILFQIN